MNERFHKLLNGDLINLFAVDKVAPTVDPTTGAVTSLIVTINRAETRITGPDAASLYQALAAEAGPPAYKLEPPAAQ